ncbi:MAG: helix-turn-helix domain-containing protein [Candidatus Nanopelagicales bacterium]
MQNNKQKMHPFLNLPGRLASAMRHAGHSQKEVENKVKVSQSQISRILNGKFKREGKAVRKLSQYAKVNSPSESEEDRQQLYTQLTEGISDVWDGSKDDAYRLLRLLEIVKAFRSRR